jgi:hypothetical protein
MKNQNNEKIINEVLEVISDGKSEIKEEKKIIYDKTTQQASIKIPKSIALKSGLKEDSIMQVVFHPKESLDEINESDLVIYLKKVKNGKGEKST